MVSNLNPPPSAGEKVIAVPVERAADHRRFRPGSVKATRVGGVAEEYVELSLKTLSRRTVAHSMGLRPDSAPVDRGREVRFEISERATIQLTRDQALRWSKPPGVCAATTR